MPAVPSAVAAARAAAGVPLDAIEALARDLGAMGDGARRITVIGTLRNVGTTMAAITLARSLGNQARVALIDLALGAPNLSIIATDPNAPGITELVRGSASFGDIITRDRYSRVHLIMAGREPVDPATVMSSQRLSITLEALARSYDHVVVDAGTVADAALDRLANLAPRGVLVAGEVDDPATVSARERLLHAGFADVTVLVGTPRGPEIGAAGTRAAALRAMRVGSNREKHRLFYSLFAIRCFARSRRNPCTAPHSAGCALITRLAANAAAKAWAATRPRAVSG